MSFLSAPPPSTTTSGSSLSLPNLDYSQDASAAINGYVAIGSGVSVVADQEILAFDSGGPCDVYNLTYVQVGNDNQNVRIRVSNNDRADVFNLAGVTFNAFNRGGPFIKGNPLIGLHFDRLKIYVTTHFLDPNAVQSFYGYLVRVTA